MPQNRSFLCASVCVYALSVTFGASSPGVGAFKIRFVNKLFTRSKTVIKKCFSIVIETMICYNVDKKEQC